MENARNTEANAGSAQTCCAPAGKTGWLGSRNLLIGVAVLGGGAMFLGWDWLVAAGVATFIVALAPCLVMCALGLCASRMGKKEAAPAAPVLPPKETQPPATQTMASAEPQGEMVANEQPAAGIVANVQPAAVEKTNTA